MGKYKTLIFDLDDTLIDNNQSIQYAFKMIVQKLGISFREELFQKWKDFDWAYWHNWESGQMVIPDTMWTLEDKITYLRSIRFIIFFRYLQIDFEQAVSINELYCNMLGVNIFEIPGARELLQNIRKYYEIIVATNGPKEAAVSKLKRAHLETYISELISSEEMGFSKPMPEFFEFLLEKSENKDKSTMLLIGDSLTTDVRGGMQNGLDTCWFNPNHAILPKEYKPTMEIHKLLQLTKKL